MSDGDQHSGKRFRGRGNGPSGPPGPPGHPGVGAFDNRACVSLMSLDFSKAFNRLDHAHVLRSYTRLGASTQVISLFASFLSGRTMRVKVADALSSPRNVNGGAPQGSCAGVQIYTVGTDSIDSNLPLIQPLVLDDDPQLPD